MRYVGGNQVKTTSEIIKVSNLFQKTNQKDLFLAIHEWIFTNFIILPYDPTNKEIVRLEAKRRWKLTATQLLKLKTFYEGKYCNDMVTIFNAILIALGYDAKVLKVFKKNKDDKILIHSLSVIFSKDNDTVGIVNSGSKDNFWYETVFKSNINNLVIRDWVEWRIAVDQWEMGLNDSSQEENTIISDAKRYYETHT